MKIRYCNFDGGDDIYVTETNDLGGLISAIKESQEIVFQNDFYYFVSLTINHYHENGEWQEEVIIYLDDISNKNKINN